MIDTVYSNTAVLSISPKSRSGRSIYTELENLSIDTIEQFLPAEGSIEAIERKFTSIGARIESSSRVGVTVSMPKEVFIDHWGHSFEVKKNKYIRNLSRWEYVSEVKKLAIPFLQNVIEEIRFPCGSFELTNHIPPSLSKHHLRVPDDMVVLGGLADLHANSTEGDGVRVVMVDSGLWDHPYFEQHGYDIDRLAAVSLLDSSRDERGHGTAMSSVLLAVSPKVRLTMVKMSCRELSFPVAALQKATSLQPDVINCSWGTIFHEPQVHLELMNAIDLGANVVCAAGNGSTDRKTAMFQSLALPDAVSVGGVTINEQYCPSTLSNISSSFLSDVYPDRHVPDVCGPCGALPDAQLILFPTEPGSDFDQRNGETDGTGREDGWLVSSGTSAAAAWVSGHLALLRQLSPNKHPNVYKAELSAHAQPVKTGVSAMGTPAHGELDHRASGDGFISFSKTKIRNIEHSLSSV